MNRSHTLTAVCGTTLVALVAAALPAQAGTAVTTFPVTATVSANCTVAANALGFGAYNPLATTAATATSALTLACVKGVAPTIGLDTGANAAGATGTTRAMAGAGSYLSYELYKDAARSQVWGNTGTSLLPIAAVANTVPFNVTVYGSIPALQQVPTGSYSDTVTATVNF